MIKKEIICFVKVHGKDGKVILFFFDKNENGLIDTITIKYEPDDHTCIDAQFGGIVRAFQQSLKYSPKEIIIGTTYLNATKQLIGKYNTKNDKHQDAINNFNKLKDKIDIPVAVKHIRSKRLDKIIYNI